MPLILSFPSLRSRTSSVARDACGWTTTARVPALGICRCRRQAGEPQEAGSDPREANPARRAVAASRGRTTRPRMGSRCGLARAHGAASRGRSCGRVSSSRRRRAVCFSGVQAFMCSKTGANEQFSAKGVLVFSAQT